MLASLGHQVGTATCSAHHETQSWALVKEGLDRHSHVLGSSFSLSPVKNSPSFGSSTGRPQRSLFGSWPVCCFWNLIGVTRWWESIIHLYGLWPVCCFWSLNRIARWWERVIHLNGLWPVCSLGGCFSVGSPNWNPQKWPHLLGCMGLGESVHLLAASPVWPSMGESVFGDQLVEVFCGSLNALGFWSAFCFLTAWSPLATMPAVRDRVAQPLYVSLQHGCHDQCLAMSIPCHP